MTSDFQPVISYCVRNFQELADSLQKLRPTLFRYAGEAAEGEEHVLGTN